MNSHLIGSPMPAEALFLMQLALGYMAWLLCFSAYLWPRLRSMDRARAQRAIAALHSFRFFGLAFILPGFVGAGLPAGFATPAAYGDLATGLLAMLALLTFGKRPLFRLFVVAFNIAGATDIVVDYCDAIRWNLPAQAGQLGGAYWIPVVYVPLLMITHVAAFRLLARRTPQAAD